MRIRLTAAAALLVLAGCGEQRTIVGDPDGDSPLASPSSASPSPPVPVPPVASPSASTVVSSPSSGAVVRACLVTPAQVGEALGGSWRVLSRRPSGCNFTSTAGAVLGVQKLAGPSPAAALAAARTSCTSSERSLLAGAFVCVEEQTIGANVVGALIAGTHAWQVLMVSSATSHGSELDSIRALLGELSR